MALLPTAKVRNGTRPFDSCHVAKRLDSGLTPSSNYSFSRKYSYIQETDLPIKLIDQKFSEYKKSLRTQKKGVIGQIRHSLDQLVYKDEAEYLETADLPFETRFSVVETLSKVNDRSGYTRIFLNELHSLIRSIADEKALHRVKILDIGAGGGGLLKAIYGWSRRHKIEVELWGLDIEEDFLKATESHLRKQSIPVKLIHGDACDLKNIEQDSFDIVVSNYMVHHIRNASKVASFLSEVHRIAHKGWLIVDLNRRSYGPIFMGVGGFLFAAPAYVKSDGIKSVRRAYRASEINFILNQMDHLSGHMQCTALPVVPYWMIKGKK